MNDAPASTRRVTPEFNLAVLVEEHRQESQYNPEADPSATLSFTTTIAEWRDACDLLPWRQLGSALTGHWQIVASDDDWQRVHEPAQQRTLLDVCGFISERAELPDLVPRGYLGAHCSPAAAFLGVRSALAAVGQDVSGVTPSTELEPYLRSAAQAGLPRRGERREAARSNHMTRLIVGTLTLLACNTVGAAAEENIRSRGTPHGEWVMSLGMLLPQP